MCVMFIARTAGSDRLAFSGPASESDDVITTSMEIRNALRMGLGQRRQMKGRTGALRHLIEDAEKLGVLVIGSGVVGSNETRKLDVDEFRGFTPAGMLAPLVFINGADSQSAQMFNLAHELVHLCLGQSAPSDTALRDSTHRSVGRCCDQVAAEWLGRWRPCALPHQP